MKNLLPKFAELNDGAPAFRNLLIADSVLLMIELMNAVTLPWWITSTGGTNAITKFSMAIAIATFILVPVVAPFGDRYCKSAQITRGVVVLVASGVGLTLLATTGVFSLGAVVALGFVQVTARAFVDPARSTILAELIHSNHLPAAIRIRKTCQSVSGIVGPLAAGLALSTLGLPGALCTYTGLGFVALFFALRIPNAGAQQSGRRGFRHWWQELGAGVAAKWKMPMERGWTAVNFITWIFQGPAVGMLIPIKVHSLGLSANWLGTSVGALSLGVLFGSVFGSQFLVDRVGRFRVRVGIGFVEGLALALAGFASSPYLMVAALLLGGFCNASMALVGATHRTLAIPKTFRVRMFATSAMTTQVASAIGPAVVGIALSRWRVDAVYTGFGLLMATCVLGLLFVPRLNEFLSLGHDQITDWYVRQYPHIFKQ